MDPRELEGASSRVAASYCILTPDDPFKTDERTYHEAVTVRKGTKYSANFWIHMYEFQQALGRGCDNQDYFQANLLRAPDR